MISFACPSCSQNYTVSDDKAGKRTACKRCSHQLVVPEPTNEAPPGEVQDWELVSEGSENAEENEGTDLSGSTTATHEPTCPQCYCNSFAFKPIYGPVSFVEKRESKVAHAAEDRDRALQRTRDELAHRTAAIEEWVRVKSKSVEAQGGDVDAVLTRANTDRESARTWASDQEAAAHRMFEDTCRRIAAEHPAQSRNRLYLVYCTGCGHVVTATPAAGNLQEGLADVNCAINRFHNTVVLYIRAMQEVAKQQRTARAIQVGLSGLNALFNEG